MSDVLKTIIESGLDGSLILFLSVISWKIYRARISSTTDSECCKKAFRFHLDTSNKGGSVKELIPAPDTDDSAA